MLAGVFASVHAGLAAPQQVHKGERIMTADEVVAALRNAGATQDEALDDLSRKLTEQCREPIQAVVKLASEGDPNTFGKAAQVLSNLGDLAVVPLLEGPEPKEAPVRLWSARTVLAAVLEDRHKLVARLDAMLADKTEIQWSKVGPVEGSPRPSRVCDEAYLMMRRLLNVAEGRTAYLHERNAFLALSDAAKDAEISKAQHSRAWTNLRDHDEE